MRIAIYGCGHSAMMMAETAKTLNFEISFIAHLNEDASCVVGLGAIARFTPGMSFGRLFQALGMPHVVTVGRAHADVVLLRGLAEFATVFPSVDAIEVTQNRIYQKTLLQRFKIPVAPFKIIEDRESLMDPNVMMNPPFFLKRPTMESAGKSQWCIENLDQLKHFDFQHFPLMVERKVDFFYEASVIGVRSVAGDIRFYAPALNDIAGDLSLKSQTILDEKFCRQLVPAKEILSVLMHHWHYVGVMSLTLFVTQSGLVVSEVVPRVQNSGDWTMDACVSSQFENHIRAISGLSLGDTSTKNHAGMLSLRDLHTKPYDLDQNSKLHWISKRAQSLRERRTLRVAQKAPLMLIKKQQALLRRLYQNNGGSLSDAF